MDRRGRRTGRIWRQTSRTSPTASLGGATGPSRSNGFTSQRQTADKDPSAYPCWKTEKTRILEFGRYAAERRQKRGEGKPQTFNFLGFTHICGRTRSGGFAVVRRTMAARMRAKLKQLHQELKRRMHHPVAEVGKWLGGVVRGHFRYYGVPLNYASLTRFRHAVWCLWRQVLQHRSQSTRMSIAKMVRLSARWLPCPRICHPYPEQQLASFIRGKSPVR